LGKGASSKSPNFNSKWENDPEKKVEKGRGDSSEKREKGPLRLSALERGALSLKRREKILARSGICNSVWTPRGELC